MPLAATGVDRCRPVESALGRPEYEIPSAGTVARAEPGSDDVWATQGALAPGGAK